MKKNKKIHGVTHTHPKHRVLITFVLIASLILSWKIFTAIRDAYTNEAMGIDGTVPAFLFAFAFGLLLNVGYQFYHFRHCKGRYTRINTLTQIWFGSIAIFVSVLAMLAHGIWNFEIVDILLVFAAMVLLAIFLLVKKYDEFIEYHTKNLEV